MIENWSMLNLFKGDIQANPETIDTILKQDSFRFDNYRTKRCLVLVLMFIGPWFLAWTCIYLIEGWAYVTYKGSVINMAGIYTCLLCIGAIVIAIRLLYCILKENLLEFEVYNQFRLLDHHGFTGDKLLKALYEHFQKNWRDT